MGLSGWESMANALCKVGLSLGFSNFLVLPLAVTVIHLSSSFSPSSDVPVHRHSLPESSFSAYPPKSAKNLMRGLKSTLSSLQIDLKRYPLYFLSHMHLSGSTNSTKLKTSPSLTDLLASHGHSDTSARSSLTTCAMTMTSHPDLPQPTLPWAN